MIRTATTALTLLSLPLLLISGCGGGEVANASASAAAAAPPAVSVAKVLTRGVVEFDEFAGRVEAVERVEIRPRVSGYIASVDFTEGSPVRKGDVLFSIDPRPYEAALKQARAERSRAVSARSLAASEQARATKLLELHALSREEFDSRTTGSEQATANVEAAQAAVDTAALDLSFTRIRAPIDGVVGRAAITAGNVVASGTTMLTTVVSMNPVYVQFQGDEKAFLKYADLARRGVGSHAQPQQPVWIGLADEPGHPHEGKLVFMDNELDAATGTIRVRALLDNSERRFTPGMFARVKLSGSGRYDALLIKDSAVGTDQGRRYVYVMGADNSIQYRPVTLGPMIDGLRVVREGVSADDTIVVNGLQRVHAGSRVTPEMVAMAAPIPTDTEDDKRKFLVHNEATGNGSK